MSLVADGPDDDGGVIAIAKDPLLEVTPPPLLEIEGAVVLGGFFQPAVEDFVHDEDAETIADVVEKVMVGIVGGANGVAAHGLEFADFPLEQFGCPSASDGATGEVLADSAQFGDLAVEVKAGVFVPLDRANAEGDFVGVDLLTVFGESEVSGVERGGVGVPELRVGDVEADGGVFFRSGVCSGDYFSIGILNLNFQFEAGEVREIIDLGLDGDGRFGGGDFGSGDEGGVVDEKVLGMSRDQSHGSVDAAGMIPSGGGLAGVVDVDFDGVFAVAKVIAEIVVKGDVAIGTGAEFFAIDGNGRVAIDAVEVDGDSLAGEGGWNLEVLAIVTDASDAIAAFVLLSAVFLRTFFPRPIVGQGDGLPVFFTAGSLAVETELPLAHEREDFASEKEGAEEEKDVETAQHWGTMPLGNFL